jgi:hypothetical protein
MAMDRYTGFLSTIVSKKRFGAALVSAWLSGLCGLSSAVAHGPFRDHPPIYSDADLIPSIGSNVPGYRERYNRPRYLGGKIAYHLSPTSQEAMNWHRSVHRGYYANHAPRMEDKYFYPKPWEALTVGSRVPVSTPAAEQATDASASEVTEEIPSPEGRRDSDRNHVNDELPPPETSLPAPNP